MAEDIGYDIGTSDDVTQSNLLNGFCKGIFDSMNDQKLETQLCYVSDKLSDKTCKVLKHLVEFIELKSREIKD